MTMFKVYASPIGSVFVSQYFTVLDLGSLVYCRAAPGDCHGTGNSDSIETFYDRKAGY